jgi:hypothetical protein
MSMSWLFTRPEGMDQFVNVRATMMEDANCFLAYIFIFRSSVLESISISIPAQTSLSSG